MREYRKLNSYNLYFEMNNEVWSIYNDSDLIIATDYYNDDDNKTYYLFIGSMSKSNFITSSKNIKDIEDCILDFFN